MKKVDGNFLAEKIKSNLKKRILNLKLDEIFPGIAVIDFGEKNKRFEKLIIQTAKDLGVQFFDYRITKEDSENDVFELVKELNSDEDISGIFVFTPFQDFSFNTEKIIKKISAKKDIDAISGEFSKSKNNFSSVAKAIFNALEFEQIDLLDKKVVLFSSSQSFVEKIIKPLESKMEVVLCDPKTSNAKEICKSADILIVKVEKPEYVGADFIKNGAVVIDFGIENIQESGGEVGDVDLDEIKDIASLVVPVPNGIEPIVVASLFQNLVENLEEDREKQA